jgi:hypothetical protein
MQIDCATADLFIAAALPALIVVLTAAAFWRLIPLPQPAASSPGG